MGANPAASDNRDGRHGQPRAIPCFEVAAPIDLLAVVPADEVAAILTAGSAHYGSLAMVCGEWISQRWLDRSRSPYRHEIEIVARRIGTAGGALLNLSYEWSCSSAAAADPHGPGNRLLRTLDWPLQGLGRHVVVARHRSPAGPWVNVTWPGFVGALTAMAPGRFSAAINQPPMRRLSPSFALDWALSRGRVWAQTAMPPSHLLRQVFETCHSYEDARARLRDEPICLPAFFILSGVEPNEGCVIERLETQAVVHDGQPACMTNHWRGFALRSRLRGEDTEARLAHIVTAANGDADGFAWLKPPVLNPATRVAAVANAARATLLVQGFEAAGAVTLPFTLPAPSPAGTAQTR
ncbi:MAG: linear amide C-N hydrolase [Rhodospirillales bacterium]|jgi:hypothetical protein|nr:linear amide C-N hydrolase [Rhodospirillales bacterium]